MSVNSNQLEAKSGQARAAPHTITPAMEGKQCPIVLNVIQGSHTFNKMSVDLLESVGNTAIWRMCTTFYTLAFEDFVSF
jgi:hypothetical protein